MDTLTVGLLTVIAVLGALLLWLAGERLLHTGGLKKKDHVEKEACARTSVDLSFGHESPRVVVEAGDDEVMSIAMVDGLRERKLLDGATKLNATAFSNCFEPIMQVTPAITTAAAAHGKSLMEVVINGPMLAARDGDGLRAIAKGVSGFEHGRLFDPAKLQSVATGAAIWQIASVVVAQKHLADISESLRRIESKVNEVQDFLEAERRATLESILNYVDSAKAALSRGEFEERTRNKLEDFEVELDRAGNSLLSQINRLAEKKAQRSGMGSEAEYSFALEKQGKLAVLLADLALCNELMAMIWCMCSIYPGAREILRERCETIKSRLYETNGLKKHLSTKLGRDCDAIDAVFNTKSTLKERRIEVRKAAKKWEVIINESISRAPETEKSMERISKDSYGRTRLLVEAAGKDVKAVFLCADQAA